MEELRIRYEAIAPFLNEKTRRIFAASETLTGGRGIQSRVSEITGVSHREIRRGRKEIKEGNVEPERIRQKGGGRKKTIEKDPKYITDLKTLVESSTRGDPMTPLLWTTKSLRNLSDEMNNMGHKTNHQTVGETLKSLNYSLQGNRKVIEGSQNEDRNAQFEHINNTVKTFQNEEQPVISVDCKKKELIEKFKTNGQEWHSKGEAIKVKDHDFEDKELGKAVPYGIYDLSSNNGFVNVGIDKDTAVFAVQSIRNWWQTMGVFTYPNAKKLMITADCGGSNGYRTRLWKMELQKFSIETGLQICVCHFPPSTSKWNKIEHRLFSYITKNWRGKPLETLEMVVNLIANTTTKTGLYVKYNLDSGKYQTGIKISDDDFEKIKISKHEFRPECNYTILP